MKRALLLGAGLVAVLSVVWWMGAQPPSTPKVAAKDGETGKGAPLIAGVGNLPRLPAGAKGFSPPPSPTRQRPVIPERIEKMLKARKK